MLICMMEHKGYRSRICFDDRDNIYIGKLLHTKDSVTFEGESLQNIENAFHEAVEDYLQYCKEIGKMVFESSSPARNHTRKGR